MRVDNSSQLVLIQRTGLFLSSTGAKMSKRTPLYMKSEDLDSGIYLESDLLLLR